MGKHVLIDCGDTVKTIIGGNEVIVDKADAHFLERVWRINKGYLKRNTGPRGATTLSLAREIMAAPKGMFVDHINHNPFDNRRANLRIVTASQNMQNRRGAMRRSKTGIRGVSFKFGKYVATVCINGQRRWSKPFKTIEEAEAAAQAMRAEYMTHSAEAIARHRARSKES